MLIMGRKKHLFFPLRQNLSSKQKASETQRRPTCVQVNAEATQVQGPEENPVWTGGQSRPSHAPPSPQRCGCHGILSPSPKPSPPSSQTNRKDGPFVYSHRRTGRRQRHMLRRELPGTSQPWLQPGKYPWDPDVGKTDKRRTWVPRAGLSATRSLLEAK